MSASLETPDDLQDRILSRLAGFFRFLRTQGVDVGIGAELDLASALRRVRLLDRATFLDVCRVTLPKSPSDLERLEAAFAAYWSALIPGFTTADASRDPLPPRPPADGRAVPGPDAQSAGARSDRAGVVRIGIWSPDAPSAGHPLRTLDGRRLAALRLGARRLRREVATLPGRRYRSSRRGRIDFPATARGSLRHGGEWIGVRRRRRKIQRAEFAVLWDVSGSMREHGPEMFALAYAIQRASRRARIFAFGTRLQDLTNAIRAAPYARAADGIARSLGPAGGGTQIGRCLLDFNRRFGALVHPWTTVVVLSDGWDLGETDLLGRELERLRRRCHAIVWVNPYARQPGFRPETAGMRRALPHVDVLLAPESFGARDRSPGLRSIPAAGHLA